MMQDAILRNLFPSPVMLCKVDDEVLVEPREFCLNSENWQDDWKKRITGIKVTRTDDLHLRPEFQQLKKQIDNWVEQYALNAFGIDFNDLEMTCMWANIHQNRSDTHQSHVHPNSFISGVVYAEIPEDMVGGQIYFDDPTPNTYWAYNYVGDEHTRGRAYQLVPVQAGLLLFPSWLQHGTLTVDPKGGNRIAISFNYIITKCDQHTMRLGR
jgi:uncharacterized protein (TIGR02466 family)